MQTQTKLFLGLALVIIFIVTIGLFGTNNNQSTDANSDLTNLDRETADELTNADSQAVTPTATNQLESVSALPLTAGTYTDYTAESVASSEAEHIVLNFSATWCPSCRTLEKNINENLSSIPAGVEIYKVDFDTNLALRKQYGVTVQHTLVVIEADGTLVNKWTGGNTLDSILTRL